MYSRIETTSSIILPLCLLLLILPIKTSHGDLLHAADNAAVSDDVLSRRWPNGVVPYTVVIKPGTARTELEFDNHRKWEELTQGAVRFVKRTTEIPYIEIEIGDDNRTNELRGIREADGTLLSGKRKIWIRPSNSWNVNHELGHVLGMWHQQRHHDSEECVKQGENTPPQLHSSKFIGPYSSDSVMHYKSGSADFVSWATDPTDPSVCPETEWSDPPTTFDIKYAQKMYGVNGEYINHTEWCSGQGQRVYMGDFNGDGLSDLLCHAKQGGISAGHRFIDYAQADSSNIFASGDWENTSNIFCRAGTRNIYLGDFDGDGRTDLLCHDSENGRRFIDHAHSSGALNGTDLWPQEYCSGSGEKLYMGDYDGDNRSDMLCHTKITGAISIDFAKDSFDGEDWSSSNVWCKKDSRSIIIGDFDGDGQDDMVCHDISDGHRWIDYANSNGHFSGAEWNSKTGAGERPKPFCWGSNRALYAADVNGNGRDDLVCHNRKIGSIAIDFATNTNRNEGSALNKANTFREISFCNAKDAHLLIGQLPNNQSNPLSASLYCHNRVTGHQSARFDYD